MVDYPLNDESDLRTALTSFGQDETPGNLKSELERAARRTKSKFGRNIEDRLWKKQEDQEEFELTFDEVVEFQRLVLNDEVVSESDYDVNAGKVVPKGDLKQKLDNRRDFSLRAVYVPVRYKDFELDFATLRVVRNKVISTSDNVTGSVIEDLRTDLDDLEEEIKRLSASCLDPESGEYAKGINRRRNIL